MKRHSREPALPDDPTHLECIHHLFEEQALRTPDAIAVLSKGKRVSFRELNQRAAQLAHQMVSLGVGPEILVGICVERSIELLVGLLAILKAGGAYMPLDPAYPRDRIQGMLEDAGVSLLLTQQHLLELLPPVQAAVLCMDGQLSCPPGLGYQTRFTEPGAARGSSLAYVLYAGGPAAPGQPTP